MKINRLFSLELERNSLRPYQIAVEVGTVFILGFIYLMAAIPKIDPGDSDAELFSSYNFVRIRRNNCPFHTLKWL